MLGHRAGDLGVAGGVQASRLQGVVDQAFGEHGAQHPVGHLMHARLGDLAARHGGLERLVEEHLVVQLRAGLLVEASGRGFQRMDRAPVGHGPAAPAPVLPQHAGQQGTVLAGVDAVDAVVGAHHRARIALAEGDLEGQQIGLARGRVADVGAQDLAAGLLVVQHKVLGGGDHVLALDAADGGGVQRSGQQRVLAEVFEVAAVPGVPGQVGSAGEQDVEALLTRLLADHGAAPERQVGAEG